MKIVLWIFQALLAVMFLAAGVMKLATPYEQLLEMQPWAEDFSAGMIKFIGFSELLGGLGMILPSLLKIKPILAPVAAIALVVVMVLAAITHVGRGENTEVVVNVVYILILLFVAWGRLKKYPIQAKS